MTEEYFHCVQVRSKPLDLPVVYVCVFRGGGRWMAQCMTHMMLKYRSLNGTMGYECSISFRKNIQRPINNTINLHSCPKSRNIVSSEESGSRTRPSGVVRSSFWSPLNTPSRPSVCLWNSSGVNTTISRTPTAKVTVIPNPGMITALITLDRQ